MKLKSYLKSVNQIKEISLCYENEYYYDKSGAKIYISFFNDKIKNLPKDFMNLDVIRTFTPMFWGSTTYIIKR